MVQDLNLNVKIPESAGTGLGKGLHEIGKGLGKTFAIPAYLSEALIKGSSTLMAPILAKQEMKAKTIKNTTISEAIISREEKNLIILAKKVIEKLASRPEQEIPKMIVDTDNTIKIQKLASETSNEDFLDFWARLYSEEICAPNSISTKTLNLCSNFNKKITTTFEKILPFCDNTNGILFNGMLKNGVFQPDDKIISINDLETLKDYGLVKNTPKLKLISNSMKNYIIILPFSDYYIFFAPGSMFSFNTCLSTSGLEIKKVLKLKPTLEQVKYIYNKIIKSSNGSADAEFFSCNQKIDRKDCLRIIENKHNKIIYPEDNKEETIAEYTDRLLKNITLKKA